MSRIRLHPSGREVECPSGDTVLSALEKAGYALPNNCRAGACGECKVKVVSGQFDQGMVLDMALSQAERKDGYGLMCMAKPISEELVIEWGTADAKPKLFPPRENVSFIVADRIMRTPRIVELHLRPLGQPLRFWPGQYVMLGNEREEAPPRCYSIANAPRADGEIVLQVTRQEGGPTSTWIHDKLKLGELVQLSGPYGTFIGDPSVETPVLCMAAGTGLAPILALAEAALKRGYKQPVTVLFSGRTGEDVYARGQMAYWQAKHRRFEFKTTLTRDDAAPLKGRIPAVLPTLFKDLSEHSVFVAGSPEFVEDCVKAAKALGAKDELIHTEGYFSQQQPEYPDADRVSVTGH
ncbi:2Fe-2S iron-sulfur cluster-binding protein [Azospirillum sp.]|uniref:2Fe-2S iron-sulfur cluster-binding protein n=1 Tax=Azospirillum sp. TaxID=34012 RepID=UPI002D32B64E|nr:2Fe-2S iron-sulfur cluster-binding protein [Azospirillum sp.]HYD70950.1 2Fe-2S iron-sulfur cluster-binding protein [Azospirillum sp.]